MRIILAGILGAIAMFVWVAIAHMLTPLGSMGFSPMSHEAPVLDAMKSGVGAQAGLYFFPWVDPKDPKMMDKQMELVKTNPSGLLLYHPPGASTDMTPMLIKEFAKEFLQSLVAAVLLSLAALAGYLARLGFVTMIGIFAALGTDVSYWIWYGFPLSYTLAQIITSLVGTIIAGSIIAALVKPRLASRARLGA